MSLIYTSDTMTMSFIIFSNSNLYDFIASSHNRISFLSPPTERLDLLPNLGFSHFPVLLLTKTLHCLLRRKQCPTADKYFTWLHRQMGRFLCIMHHVMSIMQHAAPFFFFYKKTGHLRHEAQAERNTGDRLELF